MTGAKASGKPRNCSLFGSPSCGAVFDSDGTPLTESPDVSSGARSCSETNIFHTSTETLEVLDEMTWGCGEPTGIWHI